MRGYNDNGDDIIVNQQEQNKPVNSTEEEYFKTTGLGNVTAGDNGDNGNDDKPDEIEIPEKNEEAGENIPDEVDIPDKDEDAGEDVPDELIIPDADEDAGETVPGEIKIPGQSSEPSAAANPVVNGYNDAANVSMRL